MSLRSILDNSKSADYSTLLRRNIFALSSIENVGFLDEILLHTVFDTPEEIKRFNAGIECRRNSPSSMNKEYMKTANNVYPRKYIGVFRMQYKDTQQYI